MEPINEILMFVGGGVKSKSFCWGLLLLFTLLPQLTPTTDRGNKCNTSTPAAAAAAL